MDVSSAMADLYMAERAARDACHRALCYGTVAESRAAVLAWRDAKSALVGAHR